MGRGLERTKVAGQKRAWLGFTLVCVSTEGPSVQVQVVAGGSADRLLHPGGIAEGDQSLLLADYF